MRRGSLIVLSGPSGAGKGSVIEGVMRRVDRLRFSVSVTTRQPRPGETDGVDYFFRTKEQFLTMLDENAFLEYATVHGNLYGTPRDYVESLREQGYDVLLDVDVQGGAQVVRACPDAVSVFLIPPSFETLEHRLRKRGTETEEVVRKRLKNACSEVRHAPQYDYLIVNDDLEKAVCDMVSVVSCASLRSALNARERDAIIETFKEENVL